MDVCQLPSDLSPAAPSQMEFHGEGKTFKSLSYCTAGRENQAALYIIILYYLLLYKRLDVKKNKLYG